MSQALNRLVLQPLLAGTIVTEEDLDDELVPLRRRQSLGGATTREPFRR
jgi:hypothetical protein